MSQSTQNNHLSESRPLTSSTVETLLNHRSVRQFTDEAVAPEVLETLFNVGRMVSTSNYSQAVSVVRVTDPELRKKFRQISVDMDEESYNKAVAEGKKLGHPYVETAPELLVFCIDTHRHHQLVPTAQTDWMEVTLIGAVDVALFAQNMMAAAESLGLGGVYLGSMRNDVKRAGELINAPEYVFPLFGMCLGYPTEEAKQITQKPRLPLGALISENSFEPATQQQLDDYNAEVTAYYESRGDHKVADWTAQVEKTYGTPLRPNVMDVLNVQGFGKR
ncbi:oxygen-insensitive NADPH nitroreductase [Psychrobacter sp. FDAARGOS_221]|uniref:oxygen-insensitive NADPH nitroreductase n=1 Tax=Psychrobacter sp. FDAARGOS_221 TaxID=1975705 RepID=UPI000BB59681|nr:oxygen-insensitive NADPH nitroreductase [Psychrobacter sp. FDAARGOS_221]PNK60267.1 oxygen-insensitive NADPH nitroreductase [Psychrobacter sp. FDAARGOS_221]